MALDVSASNEICLRVSDTGIGIAPENIEKVLAPFGQIDNGALDGQPGTGLGLPIAKSLVEQHGGRLELESSQGHGTTVNVFLPI